MLTIEQLQSRLETLELAQQEMVRMFHELLNSTRQRDQLTTELIEEMKRFMAMFADDQSTNKPPRIQ